MRDIGVGHHQLGERVVLQLDAEVHAGGAVQIIEAVAVLQILKLGLEHELERRAEHAAERRDRLRAAAGRCVPSVLAITSLANESCSSSMPKCMPAVRSR